MIDNGKVVDYKAYSNSLFALIIKNTFASSR